MPSEQLPDHSLGFLVAAWMHRHLVHGPGDVEGEPFRLTDEQLRFLVNVYALDEDGRRVYRRATYSRRKGTAKTELAAAITWAEFAGPVRFAGWGPDGQPLGQSVLSPMIPLAAVSEDQAEETLYGTFRRMMADEFAGLYDVGLERTHKRDGTGAVKLVSSSSASREGARPTFTAIDESHLWHTHELLELHKTLRRNLAKRRDADGWMLEVTTAHRPGQGSVAEGSAAYADAIAAGNTADPAFLFDTRAASPDHDITTEHGLIAALQEASGDAWDFTNVSALIDEFRDPQNDEADNRRYWLNQVVTTSDAWMDADEWNRQARPGVKVAPGEQIALGFDGSERHDSTALVGCRLTDGHLFLLAIWEKPDHHTAADWEVPRPAVDEAVAEAFSRYRVSRMYADPYHWESQLETWARVHGDQVRRWHTNRRSQMAFALSRLRTDVRAEDLTHDGGEALTRHVLNARRVERPEGTQIRKDHPKSRNKIDACVAAVLAYEARADALKDGALKRSRMAFL